VTPPLRRIALLGNHLPRHCGIATFTTDLADALTAAAPRLETFVLAMTDAGHQYAYPPRVRFELPVNDARAYTRAADYLNVSGADVVSVQHEYGIFGGTAGADLLALLRGLRMPIVTTLHTILSGPSPAQRAVLLDLAALSDRLIVMSAQGAELLRTGYGIAADDIDIIPHGAPRVPAASASKERLGMAGRSILLTFGLISPDKGIEHVIRAMPAVLERHPDTTYFVLGATHPHVREEHGEAYRLALEAQARELGVDRNVTFFNRFVSSEELAEFLAAADICLTPYLQPDQITSGALAYAIGAGKAVISTPYRYACEMLAEGGGVLVPFANSNSIAREINALLDDDVARERFASRAHARGLGMEWPAVAGEYLRSFTRATESHSDRRRIHAYAADRSRPAPELPDITLAHVQTLSDSTGILQHAHYTVPRYADGYCLDDNARALLLMTRLEDEGTNDVTVVRALATRYLAFVAHSFDTKSGRFRNFMSFARQWTEERGSEDSHSRAIWALGATVGRAAAPGNRSLGADLFHAALPAVAEFTSPRAWAYALLGIAEYLRAFSGESGVEEIRGLLAARLLGLYRRARSKEWPWFEDQLTYCNARLSQALIVSGAQMGNDDMTDAGITSLEWLLSVQRSTRGHFAPIGSNGFFARGTTSASFDQQPVEACTVVAACFEAQRVTGDASWGEHARRAFHWFLGQNDLQLPVYDASTGGCRDGLHADRVNANQGAEATLSFLFSLLDMRVADRAAAVTQPVPERAFAFAE